MLSRFEGERGGSGRMLVVAPWRGDIIHVGSSECVFKVQSLILESIFESCENQKKIWINKPNKNRSSEHNHTHTHTLVVHCSGWSAEVGGDRSIEWRDRASRCDRWRGEAGRVR